jgi:hypothetical protein
MSSRNNGTALGKWIRDHAGIVAALIGVVGVVIAATLSNVDKLFPRNTDTEIVITSPHLDQNVNPQETITGTSKNLAPDHEIWVVIYSYKDHFYFPKSTKPVLGATNQWESPATDIGGSADARGKFDVIALLAGKNAQVVLRNYENSDNKIGITDLPADSRVMSKFAVVRK